MKMTMVMKIDLMMVIVLVVAIKDSKGLVPTMKSLDNSNDISDVVHCLIC